MLLRLSSLSVDFAIRVLSLIGGRQNGWTALASFSLDSGILESSDSVEQRKGRGDDGERDP